MHERDEKCMTQFIKINLKAIVRECVDGIPLAQDKVQWLALRVPEKENFVTT
jgi:hypothetical protein